MSAGGLSIIQAATAVQAVADAILPPTIGNDAVVTDVILEKLSSATGVVQLSTVGVGARPVGTGGANSVPDQVAPVVQKFTGLAGPRNRGRVYWPFIPTASLSADGELSGAAAVALTAAAGNLFGGQSFTVGGASITVVPHLFHRTPIFGTTEILAFFCVGKLGTQKRRGDYGKLNAII